jgi:hypothetical protein
LEAQVSGSYKVYKALDFVYVENQIGLKIQKANNDAAYRRNKELIAEGQALVDRIALRLKDEFLAFKKANPNIDFLPIEKGFQIFSNHRSEYLKFPTIENYEDSVNFQNKPVYYLVYSFGGTRVVIRFRSLPTEKEIQGIKDLVKQKMYQ